MQQMSGIECGAEEQQKCAKSALTLSRITQRPDYLAVGATGRKWVTPAFIMQAKVTPPNSKGCETTPAADVRIGFTASKKVGNAVKRSRAKRRMKEAARLILPQVAHKGWDFVMIAREAAATYPFQKLCNDLSWAVAKLAANADLKQSLPSKKPHSARTHTGK